MRIGQNPAKAITEVAQPGEITLALITYIPFLTGYYGQSLDVLKVCLGSIYENTRTDHDILIFDNASCSEVRQFLTDELGKNNIQYLVLSDRNIGKAGAWNFIFGAAPGNYIAYSDSDIYFYPGWLEVQIEYLKRFPRTGMITGMPMWSPKEYSTATITWAENNPDVEIHRGKFLAWEDYWKHSQSLGKSPDDARQHYETTEDIHIQTQNDRLFVGAGHFQFTSRKEILQKVLPIPSRRPMGEVRLLDKALNEKGYLRLSTPDWWVRHLGNTLDPESDLPDPAFNFPSPAKKSSFWSIKPVRKTVKWLNGITFNILYQTQD